jgi:DNA-binding NarL/FixJ family response regulator
MDFARSDGPNLAGPTMPLRILIVDDSEHVCKAIKSLLDSDSNEWLVCGEAEDSDRALKQAAETAPDVILLDLSLPQVPAAEIAAKLRATAPFATIIIMSAQDQELMRSIADSLGIEHFMTKSQLGTDLVTSLRTISRQKQISN